MILASLQLIIMIYITHIEFKRKSPVFFLWASLLVFFGIMHLLTLALGNSKYTNDTLNTCSLFVILFCIVYIITRQFLRSLTKKSADNDELLISNDIDKRIQNMSIKLVVCSIGAYVFVMLGTARGLSSIGHLTTYSVMSEHTIINLACSYVYIAMSSVLLSLLLDKRKKESIIVLVCMIVYTIFSTSRINIIGAFVALIAYVILTTKRIKLKYIIIVVILGIITIYATYMVRTFRYYYTLSDIRNISFSELNKLLLLFLEKDDGDLGLRNVFYYLVSRNNNFSELSTGQGYLRLLLIPFPSGLLNGLKPEDICITLGKIWLPSSASIGTVKYTVTPTLFGDAYANFAFPGFLLGAFWAIIATAGDYIAFKKKNTLRYMYYMLEAVLYIIIGRGSVYNSFMHFIFAFLLFHIVSYFLRSYVIVIQRSRNNH